MKSWKRGIAAVAAVTLCLTSLPLSDVQKVSAAEVDSIVKLKPSEASPFHDTNGDGLGEFEGWGTSLCWWANRIGYSDALTQKAGELFFGDNGLDMNIGRYNVGGGDRVGEAEIAEVPVNEKAQFYDLETEGRIPEYQGTKMQVEECTDMSTITFEYSDADFGFTKGMPVGNFKKIGWINKIGDLPGDGDNLQYVVQAPETGNYTVKLLLTLTGSNKRDVVLGVGEEEYVVTADVINSNMIASGNNNMLFVVTIPNVILQAGENTVVIAGKTDWTLDFVKMAVIKSGEEGILTETEDEFLHAPHIVRSDSGVPGYATDVTKIDTSQHELSWYESNFARADAECGYAWNYNWDADKNQINVLKAAAAASGQDFIAEAFSNSPPYFMTVSGCSSGNTNSSKDNLRADSVNAFASYMADVIEHWQNNGITFQSATPMNEPYTNYWGANSNKQEGCHFDQGESQSRIIVALNNALKAKGIDLILSATDETSIDTQITSYNALSEEAKSVVSRIDTHTYSGSDREGLKNTALEAGKNLWMSEVDGAYTGGTNAGEMSAALGLAQRMMTDVNGLDSTAWILWNAIDMHADSSEYGQSWVNKGSANDYLSMDALEAAWKSRSSQGYWGLAAADHDNQDIVLSMKYYGYGQFSRYIRPGYTIIGSSKGTTLAAYDPNGQKAVIVAMNTSENDKNWKFDLSGFETMGNKITAIRTSGTMAEGEKWADVTANDNIVADTENRYFTATMKGNSITTYIVEGVSGIRKATEEDKPQIKQISVAAEQVSGEKVWNNGTVNTPAKVVDNNYDTFFDGVDTDNGEAGYIVINLGEAKEIAALGYAPRNGFADRCVGGTFYGSIDGNNWTTIYTIEEAPKQNTDTIIYFNDFLTGKAESFQYIKYVRENECNVSELKVYEPAPTITSQEDVSASTYKGSEPKLPETVKVSLSNGETADVPVQWDMSSVEINYDEMQLFDSVAVTGTSSEANGILNGHIICAPDNLEYLIDCMTGDSGFTLEQKDNKFESKAWTAAKGLESLLNKNTSDQKKTVENSWGYTNESGIQVWDYAMGNDLYGFGYWTETGVSIEYQLTLPAGRHDILLGCFDFWNGRNMDVYYTIDGGSEQKLCELESSNKGGNFAGGMITLEEEGVVTITVKNGGDGDPVLSWISVAEASVVSDEKVLNEAKEALDIPNKEDVRGNITLPVKTESGVEIAWVTDHPEIVDVNAQAETIEGYGEIPAGVVTRPTQDTQVTMTATLTYQGQTVTKDIILSVKAAPKVIEESDYTDYFFAYFAGEGYEDGEQIYFASSQDGMNWEDLNNNKPVLNSTLGEQGVRDPFIIRSPEGDKFYLIATDLKINGGNGWTAAQEAGSQSLMVWESTDLVNWSEQRMVEVSADIEAGCTWAPEATYDSVTGEYIVYWASKTKADQYAKQRVYYAKTRDFYTFTEPQVYIEKNESSIDTTIIENNGTYYRYTKNEGGKTNEVGASTKTIFLEKSNNVLGTYTSVPSETLNENQYVEGPTIFKLNQDDASEDTWCLLVDDFGGIGYYPLVTGDLDSGKFSVPEKGTYRMPSRARHGTPIRITSSEYENLAAVYGTPETVETAVFAGMTPDLPETVTVGKTEKTVVWNLEGVSFEGMPYSYVTVSGTVEGSNALATAKVQIIPENVEYMIDCNNLDSVSWKNAFALNSELLNSAADQPKTAENTWGYISTVGGDGKDMTAFSIEDVSNPYVGGWYARGGKNISYQVTLPAGEHQIMMGCTGWWSMNRLMDVYYSLDGQTETKLFDLDAVKSKETFAQGTITLEKETTVTLTVKKAASDDPILSWISISGKKADTPVVDISKLQEKVQEAEKLTPTDYTTGSYSKVEESLLKGKKLLTNPTTQEEVNNAITEIQSALDRLVNIAELKTYYQSNKDKTEEGYTKETYQIYQDALIEAKEALENPDLSQADADTAYKNLKAAVEGLKEETKNPVSKDKLKNLYETYVKLEAEGYTEESFAGLTKALSEAKQVLENENVSQKEVDEAYSNLQAAKEALEIKQTEEPQKQADKNNLSKLYQECMFILKGNYSTESYDAFVIARDTAKSVLDDPKATQEEVTAAYKKLEAAVRGLTVKENTQSQENGGNTVSGTGNNETKPNQTNSNGTTTGSKGANTGDETPVTATLATTVIALWAVVIVWKKKERMNQ